MPPKPIKPDSLFGPESNVADRQQKTDRLILGKLLKEAAASLLLDQEAMQAAHAILLKWAELDSSGRLAKLNETQMQGDFLAEVFGEALGYRGPDCILGHFPESNPLSPLDVVERLRREFFWRSRRPGAAHCRPPGPAICRAWQV